LDAKCIKFYEFGSPTDVLKIEYKTIEPPKDNEVLVRMLARPINPSDLIPIRGSYSHRISLPNLRVRFYNKWRCIVLIKVTCRLVE
jgi:NADPH:quinone reductase-like Zn-dependent oxidoreductase